MKTLYCFNPENDMALASGSPYYMAPASAKKMASDLAVLPAWYADEGGTVLLADARQAEWMMRECPLSLSVDWATEIVPIYNKVYPWGWNPSLLRCLRGYGLSEEACLTDAQMQCIRRLSGRWTAVEVLSRLRLPGTVGESFVLTSLEHVGTFASEYHHVLLKAPWSGSGKGIRAVVEEPDVPMLGWARRIIASQGAVVGEPFYDRVVDFAMEFRVEAGKVSFLGYSLFETDRRGEYKGNLLASDHCIEGRLAEYVGLPVLHAVREKLAVELADVLGADYQGCLGVDMMIVRTVRGYAVHPCVEINLRMNMGIVSRLFFDRYVCAEVRGSYVVEFYPKAGEALKFHEDMKKKHPLVCEGGRIKSGYMSLTPVFEDTAYQVFFL